MKSVLVVDDEKYIVEVLKDYLENEGYNVFEAYDGIEAVSIFENEHIDFIILDLMLPKMSGEEVCKKIRQVSQVPIMMLTAKDYDEAKIEGLDIGADDYVVKPFKPKVIMARVRAILRRYGENYIKADVVEFGGGHLKIEYDKRQAVVDLKKIEMTHTEFEILRLMSLNPKKVYTRDDLIVHILGYDYEGGDRVIDTHVKNIRKKIEDGDHRYIKTVYGVGYRFEGDGR